MEYNTDTLPQVLEQLQKDYATLLLCSSIEKEHGDPTNATRLTSATTQLIEAMEKVKMCIFEKRQTSLW